MRLLRKITAYLFWLVSLLMMMKSMAETRLLVNGTTGSYKYVVAWFAAGMLMGLLSSVLLAGWTATLRSFRNALGDCDTLVNKH